LKAFKIQKNSSSNRSQVKNRIDFLIKGGTVYDGSLSGPSLKDIAVTGDTITAMGIFQVNEATTVIDAAGLSVAPGFIDVHAHSDFTILADPRAEGKVSQGVTTEINGNCGMSAAPLFNKAFERRQGDLEELGIRERWNTLGEYFALLAKKGTALNLATLAGHGNVRGSVMGYDDKMPGEDDLSKMSALLRAAIDDGAIGLSTGLIYPPGVYSKIEELIVLAKLLKQKGLIYASHMRSEGGSLVEAVQEVIRIGREADIRVHISHIKTAGEKNWHKAERVIDLIEEARDSGVRLTCDRYPYIASSTDLDALLPAWTYEGGNNEELKRLTDPVDSRRIRQEILEQTAKSDYWQTVIIASVDSEKNAWMEGMTISAISVSLGLAEIDTFFRILIEEQLRVGAIFLSMNEENLKKFLRLPYCMIGSDSSARSFDGPTRKGKPHARGFGTFPRFLGRYAGERGLMGLSEAIYRSTSLPASTFGLKNRGSLREGMYADIVIFDPGTITDRATYADPYQRSSGIEHVLVNGVPVIRGGVFAGNFPGRILRKSG
jgi:N-acyl-D-amino-acid deacylase